MRNIALCMELSDFYEHGIARGLVRFAKAKPDWRLYGYGWMFRPLSGLKDWKGEGIIARVESPESADLLSSLGLPVVDVAGAYSRPNFRSVTNDDFLTGYKAGLHLIDCGFSRFAFLGVKATLWSERRYQGFEQALAERRGAEPETPGIPVFERPLPWWENLAADSAWDQGSAFGSAIGRAVGLAELAEFLRRLEGPTALFACNDTTGLRATELARRLGIAVPESLAILGVDNEDILCELASPSLSSVMLDCEAIGYRAASELDAILSGREALSRDRRTIEVPPKEIAERESTRIFACEDKLVSKAVTMIRARAHEGIGVSDLLGSLPASRRSLETRFRAAMGRSIHEEIVRAKLARAKRLLRETEETVERVAEGSGFGSVQRFYEIFKKAEGMSPSAWRTQLREPRGG
jgi:LacI family transcriptional regulator